MARVVRNYINNRDLFEEMSRYSTEYKKAESEGTKLPRISNYIGQSIIHICTNLALRANFRNYTYKDEMIADAISDCIAGVSNNGFNPERSCNPFAYFTQIAWNAYIRRITKEKKETYTKHKNMDRMSIAIDLEMEGYNIASTQSDFHNDVIRNFEDKIIKNTKKQKIGIEKFLDETPETVGE